MLSSSAEDHVAEYNISFTKTDYNYVKYGWLSITIKYVTVKNKPQNEW